MTDLRYEQEIAKLRRVLHRAEVLIARQLGDCVGCTDEPQEFCPRHGRSYSDLLAYLDEIAGQRDAIRAQVRAVEGKCAEVDDVREYGERNSTFWAGANQLRNRIRRSAVTPAEHSPGDHIDSDNYATCVTCQGPKT